LIVRDKFSPAATGRFHHHGETQHASGGKSHEPLEDPCNPVRLSIHQSRNVIESVEIREWNAEPKGARPFRVFYISFGPAFCEVVAKVATVPLDVHLMITRPDHYWTRFAKLALNITIHVEADCDVAATLGAIRESGCKAGISLKPGTPFSRVEPFLDQVDLLLVMTVEPGYGGQAFMPEMMEKVRAARANRVTHRRDYRIEVDGGINVTTGHVSLEAGADTMVAGTSVFAAKDMAAAIRTLRGE
jgi:ribulose-phosphate 3-epimerase